MLIIVTNPPTASEEEAMAFRERCCCSRWILPHSLKNLLGIMSFSTPIAEGADAPNTLIKARVRDESVGGDNPFTWKDVQTADLFNGKRVVLFALPGGKFARILLCSTLKATLMCFLFPLSQLSPPSAVPPTFPDTRLPTVSLCCIFIE